VGIGGAFSGELLTVQCSVQCPLMPGPRTKELLGKGRTNILIDLINVMFLLTGTPRNLLSKRLRDNDFQLKDFQLKPTRCIMSTGGGGHVQ
jgi:hypothetical protein